MQWGKKWGKDPVTHIHAYWGKLLNETYQSASFSQSTVGGNLVDCDTSYVAVPALGSAVNTNFSWSGHTLALRNPKFGDELDLDTETLVRRTRGKWLETFRATTWPSFKTMKFTIEKMSQTDVNNLIAFIQLIVGQQITMVDYLNRTWLGFIVTEDIDIIQSGQGSCNFEVTLSFLGYMP